MITTVKGKQYSINIEAGKLEIEFDNEETGLRKVFVFQDLSISRPDTKKSETIYYSYDITPTGQRINQQRHNYLTSQQDYDEFEQSMIGFVLKRSIVNGFFRFIIKEANHVFLDDGTLIENQ